MRFANNWETIPTAERFMNNKKKRFDFNRHYLPSTRITLFKYSITTALAQDILERKTAQRQPYVKRLTRRPASTGIFFAGIQIF